MPHSRFLAAAALLILSSPAFAQPAPANPLIDYGGFEKLVREVGPLREARRIGWERFTAEAHGKGAILLDTRSAADFARGHLYGAVNLPFSEFTDKKLETVLGPDRERAIYIYCNNNFSDNVAPVMSKRIELALNIPTFVNLVGYGYANVWELADVVSITEPRIGWTSGNT
jgi:hypothetical protein